MSQALAQRLFSEEGTDEIDKDTTHRVDDTWVAARSSKRLPLDANMT